MIIAVIILGLVIIGLVSLVGFISSSNHDNTDTGFFFGILIMILGATEIGIVSDIIREPKPKAMDVYQNKTTLEYTIRGGVKIDSVVVFKDNIYGKN